MPWLLWLGLLCAIQNDADGWVEKETGFVLRSCDEQGSAGNHSFGMSRSPQVRLVDLLLWLERDEAVTLLLEDERTVGIVPLREAVEHWKAWKPSRP